MASKGRQPKSAGVKAPPAPRAASKTAGPIVPATRTKPDAVFSLPAQILELILSQVERTHDRKAWKELLQIAKTCRRFYSRFRLKIERDRLLCLDKDGHLFCLTGTNKKSTLGWHPFTITNLNNHGMTILTELPWTSTKHDDFELTVTSLPFENSTRLARNFTLIGNLSLGNGKGSIADIKLNPHYFESEGYVEPESRKIKFSEIRGKLVLATGSLLRERVGCLACKGTLMARIDDDYEESLWMAIEERDFQSHQYELAKDPRDQLWPCRVCTASVSKVANEAYLACVEYVNHDW